MTAPRNYIQHLRHTPGRCRVCDFIRALDRLRSTLAACPWERAREERRAQIDAARGRLSEFMSHAAIEDWFHAEETRLRRGTP
mgnify:FL=1